MKAKKSLGQHWLNDPSSLQAIVDAADLQKNDVILEIGPGQGSLTQLIAQKAKKVTAVETDNDLIVLLQEKFNRSKNVEIIHSDILKFDLTKLEKNYKVIANIPYYLTGKILKILSESKNPPAAMALLVQKEVAQRITAGEGDMSILAFCIQYFYQASYLHTIDKQLFTPSPKVDSAVVKLTKLPNPRFDADKDKLFKLAKFGFSQRRKTLKNNLLAGINANGLTIKKLLDNSKINSKARAQELSFKQWEILYNSLISKNLL